MVLHRVSGLFWNIVTAGAHKVPQDTGSMNVQKPYEGHDGSATTPTMPQQFFSITITGVRILLQSDLF
jgi:hypothetical protein